MNEKSYKIIAKKQEYNSCSEEIIMAENLNYKDALFLVEMDVFLYNESSKIDSRIPKLIKLDNEDLWLATDGSSVRIEKMNNEENHHD